VLAVRRGLRARKRRLDDLRAQVFEIGIDDQARDTRVLVYLTVRARQPWAAIALHDVCRIFTGDDGAQLWRHHLDRLGLTDAHRRPSCRLVRP
jgi:hypothetical protein